MAWDERIGPRFLFPGVGYGGSCFPKDVKAIISTAKEHGGALRILEAVEAVTSSRSCCWAQRVLEHFRDRRPRDLVLAIWGLAFKPHTDDVREAPALAIAQRLLEAGATLRLHDPVARETFALELPASPRIIYCHHNYEAAEAPTPCCWSPSGPPTGGRISTGSSGPCARRRCSTAATSGTPAWCASSGSITGLLAVRSSAAAQRLLAGSSSVSLALPRKLRY